MDIRRDGIAPNAGRLLWAGFVAILAAGLGFGIRGGILANWGAEFGFTGAELGAISGAGFTGFCFGIIIGGLVCDKIGYGKLVIAAFGFHVLSALITFAAAPEQTKIVAYNFLYWGTFAFAVANGTLEAVANPLVATLFPNKRTHYLNILHASWPAGLVLGGAVGWMLGEQFHWHWKTQLALFLVPTIVYGLMFFAQKMPKSEASQKGLKLGEMLQDVGLLGGLVVCGLIALFVKDAFGPMLASFTGTEFFSGSSFWWVALAAGGALWAAVGAVTKGSMGHWLLFALFVAHALVGAVELGTDGWIQNITGNILTPAEGKILFVFTSAIMFALRFCADLIERRLRLSPVGILFVCSVLAFIGLLMTSRIEAFAGAMFALAVYAVGKTFFWPTLLAVASDRFPRTGAVAISIMGGIGMMSAGLIGMPGLGYAKDRFTGEALRQAAPAVFEQYRAEEPSRFLFFAPSTGLDGRKLGEAQARLNEARRQVFEGTGARDPLAAFERLSHEDRTVLEAGIQGDRKTLVADAFIPLTLAFLYLGLLIYFRAIGGYKPVHIVPVEEQVKEAAG